ncbi:hypothetical protein LIER_04619 [Lithospermum erythrorhizon]|uniref:Uncharacterized protein n=1 Tax=Lithospermum erythrorhizon TaxID=34254 RepID=A0AAV3NYR0_LITER
MVSMKVQCLMFLIIFSSFVSFNDARKLLKVHEDFKKENIISSSDKLYFAMLPKGKVPASTPSKKGHAMIVNEKLIARHLVAVDRILRSVPSPGVGH